MCSSAFMALKLFLGVERDVPFHGDGGARSAVGLLRSIIKMDRAEIQRHILGQAILAAGTAGGDGGDEDLGHFDFDVFNGLGACLAHDQICLGKMLAIAPGQQQSGRGAIDIFGEAQVLNVDLAGTSASAHMGRGAGSGKVNVQDLSFTKYVDSATPALLLAGCTGQHFPEANLVVRKAGTKPVEYIKIKMSEVLITSVSTGGSGGEDRLTENVTLNFGAVHFDYTPQKPDGGPGTAIPMEWDIALNAKE